MSSKKTKKQQINQEDKQLLLDWAKYFEWSSSKGLTKELVVRIAKRLNIPIEGKEKETLALEIITKGRPPPPVYSASPSKSKSKTKEKEDDADEDSPAKTKTQTKQKNKKTSSSSSSSSSFDSLTGFAVTDERECEGSLSRKLERSNKCLRVEGLLKQVKAVEVVEARKNLYKRFELAKQALDELTRKIDESGLQSKKDKKQAEILAEEVLETLQTYVTEMQYELVVLCASKDGDKKSCKDTGFCLFKSSKSFYQFWKREEGKCMVKGFETDEAFLRRSAEDAHTVRLEMEELDQLEKKTKEALQQKTIRMTNAERLRLAELRAKKKEFLAFQDTFRSSLNHRHVLLDMKDGIEKQIQQLLDARKTVSPELLKRQADVNQQLLDLNKGFLSRFTDNVSRGLVSLGTNQWLWASLMVLAAGYAATQYQKSVTEYTGTLNQGYSGQADKLRAEAQLEQAKGNAWAQQALNTAQLASKEAQITEQYKHSGAQKLMSSVGSGLTDVTGGLKTVATEASGLLFGKLINPAYWWS